MSLNTQKGKELRDIMSQAVDLSVLTELLEYAIAANKTILELCKDTMTDDEYYRKKLAYSRIERLVNGLK